MSKPLLSADSLFKSYDQGRQRLDILKGVSLEINAGEAVCISGASGTGKSTLLHILGTLDRPSMGKVFFEGVDLFQMKEDALAHFRGSQMGFVFQFHHLLSEFTAAENVMMPLVIAGVNRREARQKAEQRLKELGLQDRTRHFPSELSGGEQQRVAIARALVRDPKILFADEPTGNLDSANGSMIQELFFELKEKWNLTLVVVTHDLKMASAFPKHLPLEDGRWRVS